MVHVLPVGQTALWHDVDNVTIHSVFPGLLASTTWQNQNSKLCLDAGEDCGL